VPCNATYLPTYRFAIRAEMRATSKLSDTPSRNPNINEVGPWVGPTSCGTAKLCMISRLFQHAHGRRAKSAWAGDIGSTKSTHNRLRVQGASKPDKDAPRPNIANWCLRFCVSVVLKSLGVAIYGNPGNKHFKPTDTTWVSGQIIPNSKFMF
jgi:hypothetical protein